MGRMQTIFSAVEEAKVISGMKWTDVAARMGMTYQNLRHSLSRDDCKMLVTRKIVWAMGMRLEYFIGVPGLSLVEQEERAVWMKNYEKANPEGNNFFVYEQFRTSLVGETLSSLLQGCGIPYQSFMTCMHVGDIRVSWLDALARQAGMCLYFFCLSDQDAEKGLEFPFYRKDSKSV